LSSKELKKLPGKGLTSGKKASNLKSIEKEPTVAEKPKKQKTAILSATTKKTAAEIAKVKVSDKKVKAIDAGKNETTKANSPKKTAEVKSTTPSPQVEIQTKNIPPLFEKPLVEKSNMDTNNRGINKEEHLSNSRTLQNSLPPQNSPLSKDNTHLNSNITERKSYEEPTSTSVFEVKSESQTPPSPTPSSGTISSGLQNMQKSMNPSSNAHGDVLSGNPINSAQVKNHHNHHPNHRNHDKFSGDRNGRPQDPNRGPSDRAPSHFSNSQRPGGKVQHLGQNGMSANPNSSQQEAYLELKISGSLFRKLKELSRTEGLSMDELATELVAEGCVVRAWELVERKAAMKNLGGNSVHSGAPSHNNRSSNGFNNKQNYNPKSKEGRNNYNKIMEDNAHFLEYVRNQEKRQR
jgi:hypothetical protein